MRESQLYIRAILICLLTLSMPTAMSGAKKDSLILGKIYEYRYLNISDVNNLEDNVYAKIRFNVEKRNAILWLIPSMYVLAKDPREYIRESYSNIVYKTVHDFDVKKQLVTGTIRRNRKAMPTIIEYNTPDLYGITLYENYMLSPFHPYNKRYYRYNQFRQNDGSTRLEFKPKIYNTQLVNGFAIVETTTGRIIRTVLNGEYDMMSFCSDIKQGKDGAYGLMPAECTTAATFRFMGNRVSTVFNSMYHQSTILPDSIDERRSKELIDSLRPDPLAESDKRIYEAQEAQRKAAEADTTERKENKLRDFLWHSVGDNLVTPLAAESKDAEFRLSPIINPLYIRYSGSKGLSYKMRLWLRYRFNDHRYLTFEPTFGYNFKQRQFYFTAPLRMTYNPKRNGYAEIVWGNGNRISNSSVLDQINHEHGDTMRFEQKDADKFTDNFVEVRNNIMLFDWFDLETGLVFHQRKAVNKGLMKKSYNQKRKGKIQYFTSLL